MIVYTLLKSIHFSKSIHNQWSLFSIYEFQLSIGWDHTFRSLSVCLEIFIHFTLFDFDNFPFESIRCWIVKSHCNWKLKMKKRDSNEWKKRANAITSNCVFLFFYLSNKTENNWNRVEVLVFCTNYKTHFLWWTDVSHTIADRSCIALCLSGLWLHTLYTFFRIVN